ncbi:MAG: ABC transporter substrate-binding protein [Actinomycetota bacterium]
MQRLRWLALVFALILAVAACGGDDDGEGLGGGDTTAPEASDTTGGDGADECADATLEATEVGVTPEQITITVAADVGSTLRPALFQGSMDAINGWAEWVNANGGLACRDVVVEEYDSLLNPDEAKNSQVAACESSVAMVGTTALFMNDMTTAEGCVDLAGNPTGIPDLAVLQTEPAQQCSPVSFATIPPTGACPYTEGERVFTERTGTIDYYQETFGDDLHGVWVIPADLPATIAASIPGFRATQELGITLDDEFGRSGLSPQSDYTPVAQAIKDNNSTYARNGLDYAGTVLMRKEALAQGVDSVLVWDCSVQCYDARLISEGAEAVEDQFVWIQFLPLEDGADSNETMANFLEHVEKPDGFGAQAWGGAEFFRAVIEKIVEADGPNAITRAKILETIPTMGEFDAGGFITSTDIGKKVGTGCFVLLQVQSGEFVRVLPEEPGTFHCESINDFYEISLDPSTEFQG